ncbi:MAG: SAM-dependent methyltransferase [Nodosilinea sp. WJT8-NPBG4]|jgi:hypothetical protein|nr:SAM-dependent methyltransferase [Nodosilinea sp. WJT8-NPBG4]
MKLSEIVPWGRTLDEYRAMFSLSKADLSLKILGCGDGPASFNAEMTELRRAIISVDPVYQFSAEHIEQRVRATYQSIISQVKQNADRYVWKTFRDADDLGRARLNAMEKFLSDYESGKAEGRYLHQALPSLDFDDDQFELCLCSHLLFLYAKHLSLEFHIASLDELLRVASEVRIFPLVQLNGKPYPHLKVILKHLSSQGYSVQVDPVAYEFQKGGNEMLRISRPAGHTPV